MHFGKNLKLVAVMEYKDKSLKFVKHAFLDRREFNIFNGEMYIDYKAVVPKLIDGYYWIDAKVTALELKPGLLYSNKELASMIELSGVEFGDITKKKKKTRR